MSPTLPHAFRSFDAFDHRHSRLVMNQGIYGLFFFRLVEVRDKAYLDQRSSVRNGLGDDGLLSDHWSLY